jgi:cytochrome c peroxidase
MMKNKKAKFLCLLVIAAILFQYCTKSSVSSVSSETVTISTSGNSVVSPQLPSAPFNYSNLNLPAFIAANLAVVDNTPAANPITNNGATLGRVLFYDVHLSKNNTVSCGSCHRQDLSFADSAIKSKGFEGGLTARHSMGLLNVRFYQSGKMFWDERANSVEEQVLMPIQNSVEMGMTLTELETKVAGLSYYPDLFNKAFGSTLINSDRISKALAQFVRSIVTYQSKYDLVKQGMASFTADESAGEQLFLTAGKPTCAGCHAPPMFLTSSPAGPFALPDTADLGINNQKRFKSGSLRNIAVRPPYFHNCSISSLQNMLTGNIPAHSVKPQDSQKLLAFLQTLTDATCVSDPKYSNPFK